MYSHHVLAAALPSLIRIIIYSVVSANQHNTNDVQVSKIRPIKYVIGWLGAYRDVMYHNGTEPPSPKSKSNLTLLHPHPHRHPHSSNNGKPSPHHTLNLLPPHQHHPLEHTPAPDTSTSTLPLAHLHPLTFPPLHTLPSHVHPDFNPAIPHTFNTSNSTSLCQRSRHGYESTLH